MVFKMWLQFSDIGPHGTKIVVFNLWSNDYGDLELDFDIDEKVSKTSKRI